MTRSVNKNIHTVARTTKNKSKFINNMLFSNHLFDDSGFILVFQREMSKRIHLKAIQHE